MKKSGTNALWNELSPDQRKILDDWLFEQKLTYRQILPRAKAKLGFKGSLTSLKRYYARRRQERIMLEFNDVREHIAEISGAPMDVDTLRIAAMKLLACYLFQQVHDAPEKVKEWGQVAKLIVQNDHNELMRSLKGEENRLRREGLEFLKEKFEFDTTERALTALPQLRELEDAKKDPHTQRYEENARWNRARRAMFGVGRGVQPESAQEEMEMAEAKKEREARREWELERERNREQIVDVQPPTPSSQYYQEYLEALAKREQDHWEMGADYVI